MVAQEKRGKFETNLIVRGEKGKAYSEGLQHFLFETAVLFT